MRSSSSIRFALIALLACAPGCFAPTVIELPRDPDGTVLELASQQERITGAAVRFEITERARRLTLERSLGDPFNDYAIPVGRAVESTLERLCTEAVRGSPRSSLELWVRVLGARADCGMGEGGARATISVTLEVTLGADQLLRRSMQGAGAVTDDELWSSFGAPVGMETAFARALRALHVKVLRMLERLDLPGAAEGSQLEFVPLAREREPSGRSLARSRDSRTERPVTPTPRRRVAPVATPASGRAAEALHGIDVLLTLGDLTGAEQAATDLIIRRPDAALAFQRRAAIRLGLNQLNGALADAFRAVELDPRSAIALVTRARVYARRGEADAAAADCNAALAQPHDSTIEDAVRRLRQETRSSR